jgi:peptide/nickel transport system substrate-binding protein
MMVKKYWQQGVAIALSVLVGISLSSCNPAQFKTSAAQTPLVLSILSDPKTFNYALSEESPNIFGYTYEGLVTENPLTGEVEPILAESWEISPNGLQIIFTLRENLRWSDGQPLTVDDVVFTYNDIYFNDKIPSSTADVLRIGESRAFPTVRKLDDRRVEFTVVEPFAPFLRAAGLAILPAHALRESVETLDSEGNPVFLSTWGINTPPQEIIVNGPYKLASYRPSERVFFEKNPYYWRTPQPYIDRIAWEVIESQDTGVVQFLSGILDSISVRPEDFSLLKKQEDRNNFKILYELEPAPGITFMTFNLNKGRFEDSNRPVVDPIKSRWFNSVKFRQAIAYATDRETMIENTFQGLGRPINSHVSVQSPYYLSPEEGLKVYDYNAEKARQLLQEDGFTYNNQGQLLDSEGNRVRFTLITNAGNKIREAMGAQIKQNLSQIGIQVDFQPLAWNAVITKLSDSLDWEALIIGFGGGTEPHWSSNLWLPDGRLHMFNQPRQVGQTPLVGREIADWEQRLGDLYIQASQEIDEAKRRELYAETQRITQEYLPVIQLVNQLSMTAVRNRVQGVEYSSLGGAFWNIYELQLLE